MCLTALAFFPMAEGAEPAAENAPSENYLLSPNDSINIKVFQEDDLATTARIGADGTVSMPLIGQVKVAGQTTHDAARQIARLLDARFIVNPQVRVGVTTFARRRFTILGQVTKAGAYNMQSQESIDLLEAIGMAGGYTRMANQGKIIIKRREGGRDVTFEVNGKELAGGKSNKNVRIQAGDTVTVSERMF
jgi:polysaccharide export outer membrane protein